MKLYHWLSLLPLCTTGCFFSSSNDSGVPVGTLVVDWSIDGAKDPNLCRQSGADTIDVLVTTPSGATVGEFQAPCEDFATSIDLGAGSYAGNAVLMEPRGATITTPAQLGAFRIFGDDQLSIPIDFPASSFL